MALPRAINSMIFRARKELEKQMPVILATIASIGVGATVYQAIKAAPKAEKVRQILDESEEEVAVTTKIKAYAPVYKDTIIFGTGTIACMFGSAVLSHKQRVALTGSYVILEQYYRQYKDKVIEMLGDDGEREIVHEIVKDKAAHEYPRPEEDEILFYDENSHRYFTDTLIHVHDTEYHLNRNFVLRGYCELNEFYELLDHDEMPTTEYGATVGWSCYALQDYGYQWIDFDHEEVTLDDGMTCLIIHTPFAPHSDYMFM